jgi:uncharacterized cupin superfamily protein
MRPPSIRSHTRFPSEIDDAGGESTDEPTRRRCEYARGAGRDVEEGRFGRREQDLGRAAGSVRVGLRREVILPVKQSFPWHAHMAEEEIFVVVRGRGTLLDTLVTQ